MNIIKTLILVLISIGTYGQKPMTSTSTAKELKIGFQMEFESSILEEVRLLNIYFPPSYDTSSIKYPVIYLLDGSENEDFHHIVGLIQFLTMYELMPETIVVGIANIDRKRDFTYPTTIAQDKLDFPTTGGSENFINFLKDEVIPFVDTVYKTSETKTIIGQSLGALLATEVFLKHSEMFDQYIIVSPSLWWDNQSLLATKNPSISKSTKVFVSVGKEGKVMQRDAKKLANKIQKVDGPDLQVDFQYLPKENHATILHQAAYIGLRSLYED